MTKLSINVNKIATLRNSRGGNMPDVVRFALECERFGADGISIHPWPDERHIRLSDVYQLSQAVTKDFNIEGYPTPEFVALIENVRPTQVTLVPDSPTQLTTNFGWDTEANLGMLTEVVNAVKQAGTRAAVFVSADIRMIEFAAKAGVDRVELFAGPYADVFGTDPEKAVAPFIEAAAYAHSLGVGVNAGHDLNLQNLGFFLKRVPWVEEVSIGHAFVCDMIYWGLEKTLKEYRKVIDSNNEKANRQQ